MVLASLYLFWERLYRQYIYFEKGFIISIFILRMVLSSVNLFWERFYHQYIYFEKVLSPVFLFWKWFYHQYIYFEKGVNRNLKYGPRKPSLESGRTQYFDLKVCFNNSRYIMDITELWNQEQYLRVWDCCYLLLYKKLYFCFSF